jgi:hypothetical protein
MKTKLFFLILLILVTSCKKVEKSESLSTSEKEEEIIDLNELLVFEDLLLKENTSSSNIYSNISFETNGILIGNETSKVSYVKIPFSELNLKDGFNISFSYETKSDIGSVPQALISLTDKYSSPSRVPFYLYLAAKRITGVYGKQILWAENYDKSKGESKSFFDSYPLESNTFYFVSVNFTGSKIAIYVNSELYVEFDNIIPHDLNFDHILIGSTMEGENKMVHQFNGIINNLKIYGVALNDKQIVQVYNEQPYL